MEKLRRHPAVRFQMPAQCMEQFVAAELPPDDPVFRLIVTFDYRSRTGGFMLDFANGFRVSRI
jgi:hypothetical protein